MNPENHMHRGIMRFQNTAIDTDNKPSKSSGEPCSARGPPLRHDLQAAGMTDE